MFLWGQKIENINGHKEITKSCDFDNIFGLYQHLSREYVIKKLFEE